MSSDAALDTSMRADQSDRHEAERAIIVDNIGKCYHLYERPENRLKQALIPRLQRAFGREPGRFFRESWALRNVSFEVARGETVGIIGRNGSGKSTLLQTVCGTLSPTHGKVAVSGRIAALLELGSGFNPEFTGRENVYMNGAILGMSPDEIAAKYDDIVAYADIGDFIEQPVKTYSSGMYVRLAFAVIAHADADILVIDEALSVGDVFFAQKCMRFLRDFQKHGTVLFVSHDAGAVNSLCDRAIWLDSGRKVMDGPAKQVCEAYRASVYDNRPEESQVSGTSVELRIKKDIANESESAESLSLQNGASDDLDPALDCSRMRVFHFDPERAGFGDGGASIVSVRIEDTNGMVLTHVEGGEMVRLVAQARANRPIPQPIIGFFLKDRLGQQLFGTNTYFDDGPQAPSVDDGQIIEASFEFRMPYLPRGKYMIDIAVADGTYLEHVQAIWLYDALVLESLFIPRSTGLVGIPFRAISLAVSNLDAQDTVQKSAAGKE